MVSDNTSSTPSSGMKLSLSSKSRATGTSIKLPSRAPPSTLGKRPRSNIQLNADSDSEDERPPAAVAVTGFSSGGIEIAGRSENGEPKQKALVIEKIPNKDWRGEIRRQKGSGKNLLPPEVQAQREAQARSGDVVVPVKEEIKWGLSVRSREEKEAEAAQREAQTLVATTTTELKTEEVVERTKTEDEIALDALMGKSQKPKGPDLVIKSDAKNTTYVADTSGDAYAKAIAAAPDVSTLEDYERVPVEDFGAALLRGMGWKGEVVAQPKEGKRRLNLLGLGAKELKGAEELGAWVQKSDTKRLIGRNGDKRRTERRETASEYRAREDRKKRERDERYGGRDDRRDDRDRDRERSSRDSRDYRGSCDSRAYRDRDRESERERRR